ncbi:MAG: hypothetical protein ACKO4T_00280 [Planctomycetaceae bacterium]
MLRDSVGAYRPGQAVQRLALGVAGLFFLSAACPAGDHPELARAYGSGVHSYFAGDYQRAYEDLSQAVDGGTHDPRVWYYRGLAALKLNRTDEAEADFTEGARRERDGSGSWPVARSLERVQGCDRLRLERHRTRAGVAALQQDHERVRLRYLDVERQRPDVMRTRVPINRSEVDPTNQFPQREAGDLPPPTESVPSEEPPIPELPSEPVDALSR